MVEGALCSAGERGGVRSGGRWSVSACQERCSVWRVRCEVALVMPQVMFVQTAAPLDLKL